MKSLDRTFIENVIVYGDLNFDMLRADKSGPSVEICDVFDLQNLVKQATCFTAIFDPSLVDVFFTNRPVLFESNKTLITDTGLSDVHHLVAVVTRKKMKRKPTYSVKYRSLKSLDENELLHDISSAPLHVSGIIDDIDDMTWYQERLLDDIIDKHIPIKERKPKRAPAPYMNGKLRRELNYKRKLRRRFLTIRT